jgi:chemotaxis protein CheD
MFVDTGTPLFFRALYAAGGKKENIVVKVAGGAVLGKGKEEFFAIGKRNLQMLSKLFAKNGIKMAATDVGGNNARNLLLEIGSGKTLLQSNGQEWEI